MILAKINHQTKKLLVPIEDKQYKQVCLCTLSTWMLIAYKLLGDNEKFKIFYHEKIASTNFMQALPTKQDKQLNTDLLVDALSLNKSQASEFKSILKNLVKTMTCYHSISKFYYFFDKEYNKEEYLKNQPLFAKYIEMNYELNKQIITFLKKDYAIIIDNIKALKKKIW